LGPFGRQNWLMDPPVEQSWRQISTWLMRHAPQTAAQVRPRRAQKRGLARPGESVEWEGGAGGPQIAVDADGEPSGWLLDLEFHAERDRLAALNTAVSLLQRSW
jgi:hypothetical protein